MARRDLFVYQIKDRESDDKDVNKWFKNKILNKAVKQIKSTLNYFDQHPEIIIENEKGHKIDITNAKNSSKKRKIIIYTSVSEFPQAIRTEKFYQSSEIGLIHIFHSEDYYWICKYLVTPAEIDEYLEFREKYYSENKVLSKKLPEQYFLAHFLETLETDHYEPKYIENLQKLPKSISEFDIAFIIENFGKNLTSDGGLEYYSIIKEISKLNRAELLEFKKRWLKTGEKCDDKDFTIPYRMFVPRTDCGFVFIPLISNHAEHWKSALQNFTIAQKYIEKSQKCIGVVMFRNKTQKEYFEVFWLFANDTWRFDEQMEKIIKDSFPFREVSTKKIENRYKQNGY